MQIVLWELKKIIENKLLWAVILFSLFFLTSLGASHGNYEFYIDKVLPIHEQYPGNLTQYKDEIKTIYDQLYQVKNDYLDCHYNEELILECKGDVNDFMKSEKGIQFQVYQELNAAIAATNPNVSYSDNDLERLEERLEKAEHPFEREIIKEKINRLQDIEKQAINEVYVDHEIILNEYFSASIYFLFLLLICLMIALIPLFTTDSEHRTELLIGTSKTGRQLIVYKTLAGLIFCLFITILFLVIHFIRFGWNSGIYSVWNNPLTDFNNPSTVAWSDMTIKQFLIRYWTFIIIFSSLSSIIIMFISYVFKKAFIGLFMAILYFFYPFLLDTILRIDLGFTAGYIINYLNISMVYRYSERLLLIGGRFNAFPPDNIYWPRDALFFNFIVFGVFFSTCIIHYLKKKNIN